MQHSRQEAAHWLRKEYYELLQTLLGDESNGAIVSGEVGTGKAMLLRSVLNSPQVTLPIVRLICSPALGKVPNATLAPLMVGDFRRGEDGSVVHHALSSVHQIIAQHPGSSQLLVVVEEAQFIDPASVFVLGQLVNSGRIKLVALRNTNHHDPDASDTFNTVIRLERIILYPLEVAEVRQYASSVFGNRLSQGAAEHIHQVTGGLQVLVRAYLKLLERRGLLLTVGQRTVVTACLSELDISAVEVVRNLQRRVDEPVARMLEMLSMAGPLRQELLSHLGFADGASIEINSLLHRHSGTVSLENQFYAQGLRQNISPGHSRKMFLQLAPLLNPMERTNPEFVLWALSIGKQLVNDQVVNAIKRANAQGNFQQAMHIWERASLEHHRVEHAPDRLRSLLGAGQYYGATHFVDSLNGEDPALADFVDNARIVLKWLDPSDASQLQGEHLPPVSQSGNGRKLNSDFADATMISSIIARRQTFSSGIGLQELAEEEQLSLDVSSTLIPVSRYRLEFLVLRVRYLIECGKYAVARKQLAAFALKHRGSLGEIQGTLQALQAYLMVRSGDIRSATDIAADARAELTVNDVVGLLPLCLIVTELVGEQNPENIWDQVVEQAVSNQPSSMTAHGFWVDHDLVLLRLLHELNGDQEQDQLIELLQSTDPANILLHHTAHFLVWRHAQNLAVRGYAAKVLGSHTEFLTPVMQRQQLIIQKVQQADPGELSNLVQRLHNWGEPVLALEVLTDIVEIWATLDDPRNRGLSVRQILLWLEEHGQKPWGLIAQTIKDSELTLRESEIVELVRRGMNNRDIARELTVSQRTVEGHLYRIFTKLGISQRSELIRTATEGIPDARGQV